MTLKDEKEPLQPEAAELPENEQEAEVSTKKSIRKEIGEWVRALGLAVVIALFINFVVIVNAQIPTESMAPTIEPGDRVIGLRMAYWFDEPDRGDIVIFRYPDDETQLYVKRVIGMPGDTVNIVDGAVYLNDDTEPLDEPYLKEEARGSFGPYVVPEGHYFMMGDNRNHSSDSRYWSNSFLSSEKIVGNAWLRLFPSPGFLK